MGFTRCSGRILILLLLLAVQAEGAITRTQNVSANATSVAITAATAGDYIIVWAYNTVSATIPTLAGGFTNIVGTAGTAQAARLGYLVAAGGETSSGTWTTANSVVCLVYSGASGFGTTPTINPGLGTSLTYLAGTLTVVDGTSVWLGFAGANSATAGLNGTPTGTAPNFANRTNQLKVNGCDTAATATNLSAQTLTFTTSSRWQTVTIELKASGGATPNPTNQFFRFFKP